MAAIESGVLLEDTYEALLGAAGIAPNSPHGHGNDEDDNDEEQQQQQRLVQQATSEAESEAATASDKDKKELEVVELLVPGVIDDLVDSSELDEEVRKFFF